MSHDTFKGLWLGVGVAAVIAWAVTHHADIEPTPIPDTPPVVSVPAPPKPDDFTIPPVHGPADPYGGGRPALPGSVEANQGIYPVYR